MTEWMCRYTPIWIRRGVSLEAYLEEWEKVDVGEVHAPGGDNLPSPPTTSKNEVATQHTTTRAAHRDVCYRPKASGEGAIDAPSWKYHGTREDDVSWGFKELRVFRITTIPLCQNLRGRQLVLLTRHHGSTLVPNKAMHLGTL